MVFMAQTGKYTAVAFESNFFNESGTSLGKLERITRSCKKLSRITHKGVTPRKITVTLDGQSDRDKVEYLLNYDSTNLLVNISQSKVNRLRCGQELPSDYASISH